MANDVKYDGGDLDGTVLENAATEFTLNEILKLVKLQSDGNKAKASEATLKRLAQSIDKNASEKTEDINYFQKTLKEINEEAQQTAKIFGTIAGSTAGLIFSGIETAGNLLLEFFSDSINAFRETSSVGASFNNDLVELRLSAAQAAMPLNMFTETIKKNSSLFASFGGTVTEGSKRFAKLSSNLRTSDIGSKFMGMGYSMQDINDSLVSYMELQNSLGTLQLKRDKDITEGTIAYMTELDKLTKATGISRKQAEDMVKKSSVDPVIKSLIRALSPEKQAAAQANMAKMLELGGDEMFDALKSIAAGVPNELGGLILSLGDVSEENIKKLFQGADAEEFNRTMQRLGSSIKKTGYENDRQLLQTNKNIGALINFSDSITSSQSRSTKAAQEEQGRRNKITEALGTFEQVLNTIKGNIIESMVQSGVFKELEKGLTKISEIFLYYAPLIGPKIKEFIESLSGGIEQFFQNIDQNGITSAITNLLIGIFSELGKAMLAGVGEMFSGLFTKKVSLSRDDQIKVTTNKERLSQINSDISNLRQSKELVGGPYGFNEKQLELIKKTESDLIEERKKLIESNKAIEDSSKKSIFSLSSMADSFVGMFTSAKNAASNFDLGPTAAHAGEMTDEISAKLKKIKTDEPRTQIEKLSSEIRKTDLSKLSTDDLKKKFNELGIVIDTSISPSDLKEKFNDIKNIIDAKLSPDDIKKKFIDLKNTIDNTDLSKLSPDDLKKKFNELGIVIDNNISPEDLKKKFVDLKSTIDNTDLSNLSTDDLKKKFNELGIVIDTQISPDDLKKKFNSLKTTIDSTDLSKLSPDDLQKKFNELGIVMNKQLSPDDLQKKFSNLQKTVVNTDLSNLSLDDIKKKFKDLGITIKEVSPKGLEKTFESSTTNINKNLSNIDTNTPTERFKGYQLSVETSLDKISSKVETMPNSVSTKMTDFNNTVRNQLDKSEDTIFNKFNSITSFFSSIDLSGITNFIDNIGGIGVSIAGFAISSKLFGSAINLLIPGAKVFSLFTKTIGSSLVGLTSSIPVILSFGAAIGMGAGGLGFLMNGISEIIKQSANAFSMLPTSIKKFEDIDPKKISALGSPLIDLSKSVALFTVGGIFSLISSNGLSKLAESLITFQNVDSQKLLNASPALEKLHGSIKLFTGDGITGFFESLGKNLTGDTGLGNLAEGLNKFNNINGDNISKTVSGLGALKTTLDFAGQTEEVNKFTSSIINLIEKLEKLEETIKNNSNATNTLTKPAAIAQNNATQSYTVSASTEQQNQINSLLEQLLAVTTEMKDTNKDILSATKGRSSPL